jgi:hypothetical protein
MPESFSFADILFNYFDVARLRKVSWLATSPVLFMATTWESAESEDADRIWTDLLLL